MLFYSCFPSENFKKKRSSHTIHAIFQEIRRDGKDVFLLLLMMLFLLGLYIVLKKLQFIKVSKNIDWSLWCSSFLIICFILLLCKNYITRLYRYLFNSENNFINNRIEKLISYFLMLVKKPNNIKVLNKILQKKLVNLPFILVKDFHAFQLLIQEVDLLIIVDHQKRLKKKNKSTKLKGFDITNLLIDYIIMIINFYHYKESSCEDILEHTELILESLYENTNVFILHFLKNCLQLILSKSPPDQQYLINQKIKKILELIKNI